MTESERLERCKLTLLDRVQKILDSETDLTPPMIKEIKDAILALQGTPAKIPPIVGKAAEATAAPFKIKP